MFDYETFRINTVLCRKKLNMSQEELAEKAGLSDKNLSKIELGKHLPNLKTVVSILNAFSVSVSDFMNGQKDTSPVLVNSIKAYLKDLSSQEKDFVLKLAKQMNQEVQ